MSKPLMNYQIIPLRDMQPDPRGFRLSPEKCAAIRRRQLEEIAEREQGYIDAGATVRRAELRKMEEQYRRQAARYINERAAERRAILAEIEARSRELVPAKRVEA